MSRDLRVMPSAESSHRPTGGADRLIPARPKRTSSLIIVPSVLITALGATGELNTSSSAPGFVHYFERVGQVTACRMQVGGAERRDHRGRRLGRTR